MDIGSGGRVGVGVSREVYQSGQIFIHLNLLYHSNQQILAITIEQLINITEMEPSLLANEQQQGQARKRVKQNEEKEEGGWVVVRKKETQLTISISDYSKVNRFYSHKSLQNYLRYILTQTIPNPMWLSIKRQSLVERIVYIDVEIENSLFETMLKNKTLPFICSAVSESNTAMFKSGSKILREDLWEALLCYQTEQNIQEMASSNSIQSMPQNIDQKLYQKYATFILTPQELKTHLYPTKQLPLYQNFLQLDGKQATTEVKNWILIVDCQMVLSQAGFELARATVVNFEGEVLFDQLFKPEVEITNYNTEYSGITKEILDPVTNTIHNKLYPFLQSIICDKTVLVGHSLENDLRAMKFIHNKVIDSSVLYMRKNGSKFKLKMLADKILNRKIQSGQHDSLQDCLATLHLIRARIQNNDAIKKKEYGLLRQMGEVGKKAAIIDYAITYEMKEYTANHFEKLEKHEQMGEIFKITKKYLKKDISIPHLILTRIEKHPETQWQHYYSQFDQHFKDFFECIPKWSIVLLNCQVNPSVRVIAEGEGLKALSANRNPCFFLAV